ncbi:MAG: hypothetical protein ACKOEI_02980, partial [Chthoniobacterales bacterium]
RRAHSHHQPFTASSNARRSASGGMRRFTRGGITLTIFSGGSSGGQCPGSWHGSLAGLCLAVFRPGFLREEAFMRATSARVRSRAMG